MNKKQLVTAVMGETGYTREVCLTVVDAAFEVIKAAVESGDYAKIVGFGTFEPKIRAARNGVNPRDKNIKIHTPAKKVPSFRPGKDFEKRVEMSE